MNTDEWTWAGAHVAGLSGQGLYFVAPADTDHVVASLAEAGWTVHRLAGGGLERARQAREAVVDLLDLEPSATANLDAFADGLRDLRVAPGQPARVALVWDDAQVVAQRDLAGWTEMVQILTGASADLWDPEDDDSPENVVFETVLVVDGFGVEPLDGGST